MERFTRRQALWLAGGFWIGSWGLEASSSDFWNKKDPSEWTAEESGRLLNKSPWAKEVTAQYTGGGRQGGGGYPGGGGGGMGGPRIGIGGIGMPRGRMGGGRGRGGPSQSSAYKGVIRWESALPIRQADKTPLPDSFKDRYVISVSGIPLIGGRGMSQGEDDDPQRSQDDRFDRLKQFTTLQPKGKEIAQPGVVEQQGGTYLFGFSKDSLQLSMDDKEFDFSTRLGALAVKAKFIAKEMKYQGHLAV